MDIIGKLFGERFKKEYSFKGSKIVMQYLTQEEALECSRRASGGDVIYQMNSLKVPTLARAIVSMDGIRWEQTDEVIELLKKEENKGLKTVDIVEQLLLKKDSEIVNELYKIYNGQFVDDRRKDIEELKKV